jgi:hypothetical protein
MSESKWFFEASPAGHFHHETKWDRSLERAAAHADLLGVSHRQADSLKSAVDAPRPIPNSFAMWDTRLPLLNMRTASSAFSRAVGFRPLYLPLAFAAPASFHAQTTPLRQGDLLLLECPHDAKAVVLDS